MLSNDDPACTQRYDPHVRARNRSPTPLQMPIWDWDSLGFVMGIKGRKSFRIRINLLGML